MYFLHYLSKPISQRLATFRILILQLTQMNFVMQSWETSKYLVFGAVLTSNDYQPQILQAYFQATTVRNMARTGSGHNQLLTSLTTENEQPSSLNI